MPNAVHRFTHTSVIMPYTQFLSNQRSDEDKLVLKVSRVKSALKEQPVHKVRQVHKDHLVHKVSRVKSDLKEQPVHKVK